MVLNEHYLDPGFEPRSPSAASSSVTNRPPRWSNVNTDALKSNVVKKLLHCKEVYNVTTVRINVCDAKFSTAETSFSTTETSSTSLTKPRAFILFMSLVSGELIDLKKQNSEIK